MVKKGVSNELYSGTVRTYFSKKKADEFVELAASMGYRCAVTELPQLHAEGSRWRVTVLPKALPEQDRFRQGG